MSLPLRTRGIERLYSHQADAWHAVQKGDHVVVVTPTASGKSLCYTLPVVAGAMKKQSKALYLFPTKALAQDQVAELLELNRAGQLGVKAFTFDGDTVSVAQGAFRRDLLIADAHGIGSLAIGIRGFVSGDLKALSAAFTLSLVGSESDWTVHCTPRASSASAILSHVRARGNLGQLRSIAVELANGDSSILTILPW